MFLHYIISVRKIWTQSPILIGFFVLLPTGGREKFFVIVAWQNGLFQTVSILYQTSNCTPVQSFKCIVSSVIPPLFLSFFFLLPSISVRESKRTFGRKIPRVLYKDTVIYHRGERGKHYPYIQKQASKRPEPNPCGLNANVLMMRTCITFSKFFWVH